MLAVLAILAVASAFFLSPASPPDERSNGRDEGSVVRVVDGDTIVVRIAGREERVRYIGVDAPEVANARTGEAAECGGSEARDANAALLDGAVVELERAVSDRDRFGRLLRHVWVGDVLASRQLVRQGAVEARSYPPDTDRDAELDAAEREARERSIGIWGSC